MMWRLTCPGNIVCFGVHHSKGNKHREDFAIGPINGAAGITKVQGCRTLTRIISEQKI